MAQEKILIVEDDIDMASYLYELLTEMDYSVLPLVSSCEKVFEAIESSHPDIVLMDIELNDDMDGIEIATKIKSKFSIPVIYLTGYFDKDLLDKAMITEPYGYLVKPVQSRELQASIEMALYKYKTEKALRDSVNSYRTLADNLPAIVYRVYLKENNRMEFFNNMHEIMTGYTIDELTANLVCSIKPFILPEFVSKVSDTVLRAVKEKKPFEIEYPILCKNGSVKYFNERGKPIYGDDDIPLYIDGVIFELTEQKRMEERLRQALKFESLGVMAGGIAHDFNNILTGIMGYAEIALMDLPDNSHIRNYVNEILKNSCRAADITKQILAYVGLGKFSFETIDLKGLLEAIENDLIKSLPQKCNLKFEFHDNIPLVKGDKKQITQMINNLVTNSSEAIGDEKGEIIIKVGMAECHKKTLVEFYIDESAREEQCVYLEVSDTGPGLSESIKDKIFDPFFTTKFPGRGLGLPVVLGIARAHKGAIQVFNTCPRGTSVRILFPPLEQVSAVKDVKIIEKDTVETRTILVIDDEKDVRNVARHFLEKSGFNVLLASSGQEGIDIFRVNAKEIAFVILDVTMPFMDGRETYNELKKIDKNVKVILSSGYNREEAFRRFGEDGSVGFLRKPYTAKDFMETIRNIFDL